MSPSLQFYYRNVLLFFNRKTVSGPPSCARSPCRQWSPEHGGLNNVWGPLGTYVVLKIPRPRRRALHASRQYRLVLGRPRVGIETQKNAL